MSVRCPFDVRQLMFESVQCSIKWCSIHHYLFVEKSVEKLLNLAHHTGTHNFIKSNAGNSKHFIDQGP